MCFDHFNSYKRAAGTVALLTAEEEKRLAVAIAGGDAAARTRMIEANLGLVTTIAKKYRGWGLETRDLIQEGTVGLILAAGRYRPDFGVRFNTYAAHWIKMAIRRALMTTAPTIRVPAQVYRIVGRWIRIKRRLHTSLGREPLFDEVAAALGLSKIQRRMVAAALRAQAATQEGVFPIEAAYCASAADQVEREEQRVILEAELLRLESQERCVLTLRYGLGQEPPQTVTETGRRLGLNKWSIRRIETQAKRKLAASWLS